jgi:hypothetical protein
MNNISTRFLWVSTATLLTLSGANATSVGLPSFMTAPTNISITNQFDVFGLPTSSYTLSFTSTIASAQGADALVGKPIHFSFYDEFGYDDGTQAENDLTIGGIDLQMQYLAPRQIMISPPVASETDDPATGLLIFDYDGIFAGFGPRISLYDTISLVFTLPAGLPTKTGFLYCEANSSFCEYSNIAGLTEIRGHLVSVDQTFTYPEGEMRNAAVTFATVQDRKFSPVPLPAGGWLFAAALSLLGFATRRKPSGYA